MCTSHWTSPEFVWPCGQDSSILYKLPQAPNWLNRNHQQHPFTKSRTDWLHCRSACPTDLGRFPEATTNRTHGNSHDRNGGGHRGDWRISRGAKGTGVGKGAWGSVPCWNNYFFWQLNNAVATVGALWISKKIYKSLNDGVSVSFGGFVCFVKHPTPLQNFCETSFHVFLQLRQDNLSSTHPPGGARAKPAAGRKRAGGQTKTRGKRKKQSQSQASRQKLWAEFWWQNWQNESRNF